MYTQKFCLLIYKDVIQSVLKFQYSAYDNNNEKEKQSLHTFFLSVMAANKCNLVGGKEKEVRNAQRN